MNRTNGRSRLILEGLVVFEFAILVLTVNSYLDKIANGQAYDSLNDKAKAKLLPIAILLAMAFALRGLGHKSAYSLFIVAGLFFSAVGDYMLVWDDVETNFLLGLGSFFLAHACYILAFRLEADGTAAIPDNGMLSLPFVLFGLGAFVVLKQNGLPRTLRVPVMAYCMVIALMLYRSFLRIGAGKPSQFWRCFCFLGCCSFAFSDSYLAFNKFAGGLPNAEYVVMSSYYLAQFCITTSLLSISSPASPAAPAPSPAAPATATTTPKGAPAAKTTRKRHE